MSAPDRWCKSGLTQAACIQQHAREALPAASPRHGKDRQCPICAGNLSLNPGDKGAWLMWTCHEGCHPETLRETLETVAGIDPACLGSWYSGEWKQRQEQKQRRGASTYTLRPDAASIAAVGRSYAYQKLISAEVESLGLLKVCMQAVAESDGTVSGDPDLLLPRDYRELAALARRAGIERSYSYRLARSWICK